jgi:outer membrane cobalamin receptor
MFKKSVAAAVVVWWMAGAAVPAVMAEDSSVQLKEVVVTATKTEKEPQDVTQSVTVITAADIQKSSATTAAEVVREAAGVDIRDYGARGSTSEISLRGSATAQVLVLLDGKRLNSPLSGGFDMSELPVALDDIERIEIVRGPSSALYGTDAMGGVVNIITKHPEKFQTVVSGSVGSHGYDSLSLRNSGKQNGFYYALSAGRETSDGYRVNSDLNKINASIKAGYELSSNSSIELTSDHINKEIGVPGSTSWPSPSARQTTSDTATGIGYRVKFSPALDLKINAYYSRENLEYKNPPVDSVYRSASRGADTQVTWLANSWNLITVGAEGRDEHVDSPDTGIHSSSLWAGYLQDEISAGEHLIVVIGGREDSHSVYGDKFSPKVSARYLVSGTGTIVRASAGKSFRAPTFNDLYFSDAYGDKGNPDLRPETATEYEAGIEQPFGKRNAVKVTGFERKVTNLIDWQEYAPFQYQAVNIGKAKIRGSEAEAKFTFFEVLTWAVNYTYMNPVNELTGEKIYYTIPESQLKSSANLALSSKTNIYVEGRYVKNYVKPTDPEWDYIVIDGKITQTVYQRESSRGSIVIGMNNIFDRKYETVKGYPMPPAEVYGGVSIQF